MATNTDTDTGTGAVREESTPTRARRRFSWMRLLRWTGIGILLLFVAIQLVPYGRDHSNPPVNNTVQWDSPRTETLFANACADCHSNDTSWPWYSNVAPVSWLVQRDVDEGRDAFNVSDPNGLGEAHEAAETVQEGEMPPWFYDIMHSDARLSDQEITDLVNGLIATFGEEGEEGDD